MSHHNEQVSSCDWRTPQHVLTRVTDVFGGEIELDPATARDNPTNAAVYYTSGGLEKDWSFARNIFLNPPWSKKLGLKVEWWAAVMWDVMADGDKEGIAIYPASVNAKWFHKWVIPCKCVCFPRGRIAYDPPPGLTSDDSPTFDTAIAYWGKSPAVFVAAFHSLGWVVVN